jgi:hypothetical protein
MLPTTITLSLGDTTYTFPRKCLYEFFESRRDLVNAERYPVQSSVPPPVFESFLDLVGNRVPLTVTDDNVAFLMLLADEFARSDVKKQCTDFCAQ